MKKVVSKQWSLQARDFLRAGVISVISAVGTAVLQSVQQGHVTINWASIGNVAIIAAVSYLVKNLAEPTKTIVKGEPK
jgi:hypothetical protein